MPRNPLTAAAVLLLALASAPTHAQEMNSLAPKMRAAAEALIASVDERRRAKLVLPFPGEERSDWHYTPRSRAGLTFAELDAGQRDSVHRLLKTALSAAGHRKVVNIIELELVLKDIEFALSLLRDPDKYSIAIWGKPDAAAPWGWRFEGHHISLNFTLRGDSMAATTPSFLGANPALVGKGAKKGQRALALEEDEARKLLEMLDDGQRKAAIVDTRTYGDIVTGAKDKVGPIDDRGLEVRAMNAAQRAQLRKLIEVYADNFEPPIRAARLARAAEGFEGARFAWAGSTRRGEQHYYRVQGPKILIEYDASQGGGNHVHTVWRDFDGDFGRDLLKEHYEAAKH